MEFLSRQKGAGHRKLAESLPSKQEQGSLQAWEWQLRFMPIHIVFRVLLLFLWDRKPSYQLRLKSVHGEEVRVCGGRSGCWNRLLWVQDCVAVNGPRTQWSGWGSDSVSTQHRPGLQSVLEPPNLSWHTTSLYSWTMRPPTSHFWSRTLAVVPGPPCNQLVARFWHCRLLSALGLSLGCQSSHYCWWSGLGRLSQCMCLTSLPLTLSIFRGHLS